MKKLIVFLVLMGLLLAACEGSPANPSAAATGTPTTAPIPEVQCKGKYGSMDIVVNNGETKSYKYTNETGVREVTFACTDNGKTLITISDVVKVPAATATATALPATATVVPATATLAPTATLASNPAAPAECKFDKPEDLDKMAKNVIELAQLDTWFHRVYDPRLFNEANKWGGADSWFVTLALGKNAGGAWISHGNL